MARFSKGQKRIANCILSDYDTAAFMTAGRLGRLAEVSESTVVRFAAMLGYDGYPDMQRALQARVRSKLTSVQGDRADDLRRSGDVVATVLQTDMDRIRRAVDEVDRVAFEAVVEKLLSARHIYLLGVRSSSFLAGYLHFYFRMIFENVTLVTGNGTGDVVEDLIHTGPGDLLLAVSFPRYAEAAVKGARFALEQGAEVVSITDSRQSPLAALASESLLVRGDMISFVDSPVVPFSLLNALIVAAGHRKNQNIDQIFRRLEGIWEEYGVFGQEHEN